MEVSFRMLLKNSQTGWIYLQLKNLCLEFWEGCEHNVHSGEDRICILCNLALVRHVFLKTRYCKSLPSMILEVLASLIICDWSVGGV